MIKLYFSLFFFGCVLYFSIKNKMWSRKTLGRFKIKGSILPKIIVIIGYAIFIYFFITNFILKDFYAADDIYSFLYLIMLLLFMTHLTYGKLLITENGVIYKGRFLKWYNIENYYFDNNELIISYKGTIENEIAFKIQEDEMEKIDYYLRTRIK